MPIVRMKWVFPNTTVPIRRWGRSLGALRGSELLSDGAIASLREIPNETRLESVELRPLTPRVPLGADAVEDLADHRQRPCAIEDCLGSRFVGWFP